MFDFQNMVIIAVVFLIAGTVKGVIGLGLPTVSLALLTATVGLHPAIALFLAPSLITNIWQAAVGGSGQAIIRRIWPFLLASIPTVWIGSSALSSVDVDLLSALLGLLLVSYSIIALAKPHITLPPDWNIWAGPVAGIINGILTGMTGSQGFPGILYLQALNLSKDMLVQAMGMLFASSTLMLALSLGGRGMLSFDLGFVSLASTIPALTGMILGKRLRQNLSDKLFRQFLFIALLILGIYILVRSFM